jgi:hypothetical protein
MPGKNYQYTKLENNTFNYPRDGEGLLLAGTMPRKYYQYTKLQKNTFNYPGDGERLALGGNNAALCKMRGRRWGQEDPRQLGVDECALRLLTARLPQGDQSDLQEVRVVLVHVCDGPQTDDLNGLVLPATRTLQVVGSRPFKLLSFKETKNRFPGTNSARLCSLAGRYDNPIPT